MKLKTMVLCLLAVLGGTATRAELTEQQRQEPLEALPTEPGAAKIVLLAGAPSNKPGQHEYFAGCALMAKWLRATEGVAPVLVADGWPTNEEQVLEGARCVVLYLDGGAKLPFLAPERWSRMRTLADAGCGFVVLHQAIDCPADRAADFQEWFGAVFQSDIGCRGHWDVSFETVPAHPVNTGVVPFPLLKDGWLYNLHFAAKGVQPILACAMPDRSRTTEDAKSHAGRAETVAWAYDRPNGGRSFGFTGCDLHSNWAEPNQRRLVLNGILWASGVEVPNGGVAAEVTPEELKRNWDRKVFAPKAKAKQPPATK